MSHAPSSWATGVGGTVGAAAQTVATTKYSVHTAAQCPHNRYGDRYMRINVVCDNAYTLYVYGSNTAFASGADAGAASGNLVETFSACAATTGATHYARIAGHKYAAPVLYQAGGDNATVTLTFQTFNP
jgi:hypothetical protein